MTNILYLSYDGLTDPLGQSQIVPYLEGLSSKGYRIHIVSFEKRSAFDHSKKVIYDKLAKARIQWHPQVYHKSPPILSTLWDLFKMWQAAKKLHKKYNFQIIHCRSYIASMVGLGMKRKYETKFLFDMRGFWADERVDGELWDIKKPVYKVIYNYFKKQEKAFLENADAIVSLTHHAKREMGDWKNVVIKAPIYVIPCCVDLGLFNKDLLDTKQIQAKKKELGVEDDAFVLTYLGAIGTWYMLDEMLDLFKMLQQIKHNAKFLFISADRDVIMQKAESKNIPSKSIIVYKAERSEVPLLLSLAHLSIFFIKPAYSKKASSPTKQGELMAMGIPIICNAGIGDTDEIVNKCSAGKLIRSFTISDYSSIVEKIDELENLSKEPIIKGAQKIFSLQSGVEKYSQIYTQLLS